MLRRRIPSATPSSTQTPSSSGPRCRMTSHIRWTSARLASASERRRGGGRLYETGDAAHSIGPWSLVLGPLVRRLVLGRVVGGERGDDAGECELKSRRPATRIIEPSTSASRATGWSRRGAAEQHARIGFEFADAPGVALDRERCAELARTSFAAAPHARRLRHVDAGSAKSTWSTDAARVMRIAVAWATAPASAHTGTPVDFGDGIVRVEVEHADHPERRASRVAHANRRRPARPGRRRGNASRARSPRRRRTASSSPCGTTRPTRTACRRVREDGAPAAQHRSSSADRGASGRPRMRRAGTAELTRSATTTRSPCSERTRRRCSAGW